MSHPWWPVRCAGCGSLAAEALCGACRRVAPIRVRLEDAALSGVIAVTRYDGPLGAAVRQAKGGPDRRVALALGAVFAASFAPLVPGADRIVPVPAGPWRTLTRGFALPHVLAASLALGIGRPVDSVLVARATPRLAGLGRVARKSAVLGRHAAREGVCGRVLLVDDVVTSGATLRDAARVLVAAGAREVWGLTLCVSLGR